MRSTGGRRRSGWPASVWLRLGWRARGSRPPPPPSGDFSRAVEEAGAAHAILERALGPALAQYAVPLAFHVRWYLRANLREIFHLCELRTTPQGHPDYRWVAQQMFVRVQEVHPRLAAYATFVDLSGRDELERRASERRVD